MRHHRKDVHDAPGLSGFDQVSDHTLHCEEAGPRAFVLKCRSQSSRLVSRSVPRSAMPAEFTRPLTLPKCAQAVSTSLWQSSAFETSAFANRQSVRRERTLAAAASPFLDVSATDDDARRSLERKPLGDCQPEALRPPGNYRDSRSVPREAVVSSCQVTSQLFLSSTGLPEPKRRSRCLRQIDCSQPVDGIYRKRRCLAATQPRKVSISSR